MDNKITPISNFEINNDKTKKSKKNAISDFFSRSTRTIDFLTDENYRNYRKNSRGMTTDLRSYDQEDLKYLKRDFKIEGKNYSAIEAQIKENKASEKILRDNVYVKPLSTVETDKGKVTIAIDERTKELKVSNGSFLGNENIPMWTNFSQEKVDKRLRDLGEVKNLEIKNDYDNSLSGDEFKNKALKSINQGLENTPAIKINHIKNLEDNRFLSDKKIQNGQLVTSKTPIESETNFKVLSSDRDNIVLTKLNDPEQKPVLINRDSLISQNAQKNIDYLAIADTETMLGYNRADNRIYVGTINDEGNPEWRTKESYLKSLDNNKAQKFKNDLESGNMIRPFSITQTNDGNFKGMAINNTERFSANRQNWFKNLEELKKSQNNELTKDIAEEIATEAAITVVSKSIGL